MKALALVDAPDHVCCRYRIRAFEPALAAAGWSLAVEGLASGPLARAAQLRRAAAFDAVVLQRKLLPAWQLHVLRRATRRLVFDFDDAVLYRDSYDERGPLCPRRAARFARTVRHADAVLAGNDYLAECAREAGARAERIRVLPTCVDPARYRPAAGVPGRVGLHLVWIGSSSTLQGLEQQRPLWEHLGRLFPGLKLRVIGDRFPRFEAPPVIPIVWSEVTEAADLAAGDVGIGWVPDDLRSRGKCGLKLLQYQAAGLPAVANPVGVHAQIIEPGVTGFLAEGPAAWVKAIGALADDPALRARMGRSARAAVEARYSVGRWGPAFVAAVAGAPAVRWPVGASRRPAPSVGPRA
ncbi:MAG TPA: glycosyltransferase family 4 protein [Isosphaeraceae bacterium]|jgi:glycosyltransferase involved in cell wall biosynthesis